MRYSRSQLRTFEVGSTSTWVIHFQNLTQSNLIAGTFFPAISVKFDLFEPINHEIEVGPGYKFSIPVLALRPQTVDIEFYDNDSFTIHSAITDYVMKAVGNGRSILDAASPTGIASKGIQLVVEKQNKSGKVVKTYHLSVWPSSPLNFSGDQEFKALQNSLTFTVLSYEDK